MCSTIYVSIILTTLMMIQSGLAIKCFICDSDTDEICENVANTTLVPKECDDEIRKQFDTQHYKNNKNFLLQISDPIVVTNSGHMVCQMLIGTDGHQKRSVVRRCQLAGYDCDFVNTRTKSGAYKDIGIEACATCDDNDGCNYGCTSSASNQVLGVTTGVAAVAVIVFGHLRL